MNLILLDAEPKPGEMPILSGRQFRHIKTVLKSRPGDFLRVGVVNGMKGRAKIAAINQDHALLEAPDLTEDTPQPWFDVMLAMPRPKVMHRLFAPLASLGAANIAITGGDKVEKCYFSTHYLEEENYRPLLAEGLEQAGATHMPNVMVRPCLKSFLENEFASLFGDSDLFLAHPRLEGEARPLEGRGMTPQKDKGRPLVAVGPEGGWSKEEFDMLEGLGFCPVTLGQRALRSDVAVMALAGALAGAYTIPRRRQ